MLHECYEIVQTIDCYEKLLDISGTLANGRAGACHKTKTHCSNIGLILIPFDLYLAFCSDMCPTSTCGYAILYMPGNSTYSYR